MTSRRSVEGGDKMSDEINEEYSIKKRGRPRTFNYENLGMLKGLWSEIRTTRGIIETYYMLKAYGVIKKEYDADKIKNKWAEYYIDPKQVNTFHISIMAALGRIDDEEIIVKFAKQISEEKRTTRD